MLSEGTHGVRSTIPNAHSEQHHYVVQLLLFQTVLDVLF